jgi:hypothetical protein
METGEKVMSGEESLKIISDMINKTRINIRDGIFHLLFWGWLIFICALGEYVLSRFTGMERPWLVWLLTIPGVFVSFIYGYMKGRKSNVQTYADWIYMWTWITFIIAAVVLFLLKRDTMESFTPYILMLAGTPTFLSGIIARFNPLVAGGVAFWIFAIAAHFVPEAGMFIAAAAVLGGYLIPGYMLKRKVDHDSV